METIFHLLEVPANKREELQKALTTKEGLAGWWTTKTEQPDEGSWRFHFDGGYHKDFKVKEASPEKVVWECVHGHPEWVGTELRFDMQENDGKLMLQFRHSKWEEQSPMYGICNYHWALYMKSLKDLVEKGQGQPTPVA